MAPTPRQRISGCAQWWPARTQTASRSHSSAMSCGWIPSIANATTPPRRSRSDGPYRWMPSTSGRRSRAYAVRSRSWARMLLHADRVEVLDRRAEPDGLGGRRGAGLELEGQLVPGGVLALHARDHVARRRGTAACRRAARAARAAGRSWGRAPCGRSRRRSPRRSRAGPPAAAAPPARRRSRSRRRPRVRAARSPQPG